MVVAMEGVWRRTPLNDDAQERRDDAIFRDLYPALRSFAAICAPPWVEPDDLLQQALANTLTTRSLSSLTNPGAYLRTAIANSARSSYRRKKREPTPEPAQPHNDAYPSDLGVLGRLRPDDRAALFLVEVERFSYEEAAELLGVSLATLKVCLNRGRRQLRRHITRGSE